MTPKERALRCINRQPVDKIPVHHIQFSAHAARVILGREAYVGGAHVQWREMEALWQGPDAHREFVARCRADAVAIAEACGHDVLRLSYWRWPAHEKPVRRIDDYTFLFGDPDGRWYTMTYHPETELFTRVDGQGSTVLPRTFDTPDQEITEAALLAAVEAEEERTARYTPRTGPHPGMAQAYQSYPDYLLKLGGGTVAINMESVPELMAAAQWPELYARKLMAQARRYAMDVPSLAAAGMQVYFAGCDFCTNTGPMVSPALWNDTVVPALKVIVDACHAHGIRYFYSSDGNFWPVADAMFNTAGVDGWFETDKSAGMDLRRLRETFPHVTLVGNIRTQVLHRGTRDDVVQEVMSTLEVAHELGGVIVGTSNMIMPGTPPENILTMLEVIERNR